MQLLLSEFLRIARARAGLTRRMATEALGRATERTETIARYERGDRCPDDPVLADLLRIYRVPEVDHELVYRLAREWRIARAQRLERVVDAA